MYFLVPADGWGGRVWGLLDYAKRCYKAMDEQTHLQEGYEEASMKKCLLEPNCVKTLLFAPEYIGLFFGCFFITSLSITFLWLVVRNLVRNLTQSREISTKSLELSVRNQSPTRPVTGKWVRWAITAFKKTDSRAENSPPRAWNSLCGTCCRPDPQDGGTLQLAGKSPDQLWSLAAVATQKRDPKRVFPEPLHWAHAPYVNQGKVTWHMQTLQNRYITHISRPNPNRHHTHFLNTPINK